MPKVSVIIPVYNVEKYLKRCLDSLVNQTFNDIEIICINDGSTDNSLKIIEEYAQKDSRIKLFSQENKGSATARNVGLDNANGEYLMFCDSDDWYESQMVEKMFSAIEKENVDLVVCDVNIVIDETNDRKDDTVYPRLGFIGKVDFNSNIKIKDKVKVLLWKKIFRKSLVDKYNIRFPDGHKQEDCTFIRQYVLVAKNAYGLNEKLYNYVYRTGSVMSKAFDKGAKDCLDTLYCFDNLLFFLSKIKNIGNSKLNYVYDSVQDDAFFWYQFVSIDYKEKYAMEFIEILQRNKVPIANKKSHLLIYYAQKNNFKKVYDLLHKKGSGPLYLSFWQKLFSIKNTFGKKEKLITILGVSFKIKRKVKNA